MSLLLVAICGGAYAADDVYFLKLTRPNRVGEKLVLTAREDESRTTSPGGDATPEESGNFVSALFEGEVEVAAIDSKGRPTQLHVVIHQLAYLASNGYRESLPTGTMLDVAFADGKATCTPKDGVFSEYQGVALDMIFGSLAPNGNYSDDDIVNDGKPHRVGDTWPMHTGTLVKNWKRMKATPENAKGAVTLRGVGKLGAKPALDVTGKFSVTHIELPEPNAAGAKMDSTYQSLVPIDPADTEMHGVWTTHMTIAMKPQAGEATGKELVVDRKLDIYFKPTN